MDKGMLSLTKPSLVQSKCMSLLLSITFLGFYWFFPFAQTTPDTPRWIWHAAANPSASLHRADCRKWNFAFPFASHLSHCCRSPRAQLQALPLCPGWCRLLDWEQMADGAGAAAAYALQRFPSDLESPARLCKSTKQTVQQFYTQWAKATL